MTKLFSWLLKRFITAFAVLVIVQLFTYILGLSLILSGYEENRFRQYEEIAIEILNNPQNAQNIALPGANPFFVFSDEKELVFSNKGKGRSLSVEDINPVYSGDKLLGYFHAGELGFADNQANRVFLISVIVLSGISVVLSVLIGFFAAWLSSGRIAEPVGILRRDIHDIRRLKRIPGRNFEITELTDISSEVSEVSIRLSSQEEYKRQWLRDLSHDLRTPLSGLKSQLEAMADGVLEPSPERFRRHLLEIDRLENLAASIGELTAIEMRDNPERTEINTERFIEMLVSPFEIEIQRKSILLESLIEKKTFSGDEPLLLRGLGNIISNAVKYIEDGSHIWIRVSETSDNEKSITLIEIANDGPGIPPEQRELIFTRLYRGESGRSTPGSGLGLSITREIVNLHGGEIRVEPLTPDGSDTRGVRFAVKI